jgi:hypothetical protein
MLSSGSTQTLSMLPWGIILHKQFAIIAKSTLSLISIVPIKKKSGGLVDAAQWFAQE